MQPPAGPGTVLIPACAPPLGSLSITTELFPDALLLYLLKAPHLPVPPRYEGNLTQVPPAG